MNNLDRIDKIDKIFVVDVTSADVTIVSDPSKLHEDERFPCRAILADYGGEVKVDMWSHEDNTTRTVVLSLPDQIWIQCGNITKVYKEWKASTDATAQVYDSTGTLVNGIKLGR